MADNFVANVGITAASQPINTSFNPGAYMQGHYNHPAFNKLYLGPSQSGKSYVPKPPKAPEKPLMPYMRYSRKIWDEVKSSNSELKLWEVGKIIGQMWRELPAVDKQQFNDDYEAEKSVYNDAMKSYHNSPAYQGYLQAKARAEALEAASEHVSSHKDDAYMSIEPADDGTADDEFSVKHVAAARFQRNHRLINDILGDATHVPNLRVIVTNQRLNVLKNQVKSLQVHQQKLDAELVDIEATHAAKKAKWRESCTKFAEEMKKLQKTTPQEFYQEWKKKQAEQREIAAKKAAELKQQEEAKKQEESEKKVLDEKQEKEESKTEDDTKSEEKMETEEEKMESPNTENKEEEKMEGTDEKTEEEEEEKEVVDKVKNDEAKEPAEENNVEVKKDMEQEDNKDKEELKGQEPESEIKKESKTAEDSPPEEVKPREKKKKVDKTPERSSRAHTRSRSTSDDSVKNDRKRRRKSDK